MYRPATAASETHRPVRGAERLVEEDGGLPVLPRLQAHYRDLPHGRRDVDTGGGDPDDLDLEALSREAAADHRAATATVAQCVNALTRSHEAFVDAHRAVDDNAVTVAGVPPGSDDTLASASLAIDAYAEPMRLHAALQEARDALQAARIAEDITAARQADVRAAHDALKLRELAESVVHGKKATAPAAEPHAALSEDAKAKYREYVAVFAQDLASAEADLAMRVTEEAAAKEKLRANYAPPLGTLLGA